MRSGIALVLAFLLAGPIFGQGEEKGPKVGDELPTLSVRDWINTADGQPIDPATLRGKVVIVEFWGKWCPPCRAVIPHMKELYEEYKDTGRLVIIAVHSTREGDLQAVADFVKENAMPYPVCIDQGTTANDFGIPGYPHAFVFGGDGTLAWRGHPGDGRFELTIQSAMLEIAEVEH